MNFIQIFINCYSVLQHELDLANELLIVQLSLSKVKVLLFLSESEFVGVVFPLRD